MTKYAQLISSLLFTAFALPVSANQVTCHVTYGGQTEKISVSPSETPYTVTPKAIGSYFLFRAVFRDTPADLASIKLYTYVDNDVGPTLIHQASYPYPVDNVIGQNGFTGHQRVYEPIRDSELEYWCELQMGAGK